MEALVQPAQKPLQLRVGERVANGRRRVVFAERIQTYQALQVFELFDLVAAAFAQQMGNPQALEGLARDSNADNVGVGHRVVGHVAAHVSQGRFVVERDPGSPDLASTTMSHEPMS